MAVPKRKTSKSRRDKRRTHYKLKAPTVGTCPPCGEPVLPHRACGKCGQYQGMEVVPVRERPTETS